MFTINDYLSVCMHVYVHTYVCVFVYLIQLVLYYSGFFTNRSPDQIIEFIVVDAHDNVVAINHTIV